MTAHEWRGRAAAGDGRALVELRRRTAMLDAVAYAATRMVGDAGWRDHVPDLLERLGLATEMSRVTLFEVHRGPKGHLVQSCRFDWGEPGMALLSSDRRYRNMPLSDDDEPGKLGEWSLKRQRGEIVQATLGDVTGYTRQVFLEHGTLSFLSVPVTVGTVWWGFLGFDDCRTERIWSEAEIHVLRTAAALIAGAIEREWASDRLKTSEERYALAARGANDGLWDWDMAAGTAYFSPRLHEVLGLKDGQLGANMQALFNELLPIDAATVNQRLWACYAAREERFELEARLPHRAGRPRWIVMRGLIVYDGKGPRRIVGALRDITTRKVYQRALKDAERKRANLARYFSPNMVEDLMASSGRLSEARTQTATVLFTDIWGFSRISAKMAGTDVIALLREYLGLMEAEIFAHGGTLDKFLGDGLMATFGTPRAGPQDATNALRCACAIVTRIAAWNTRRREAKLPPLLVGIGLHHGEVVLGDIGSEQRMEFAVIGDTVNIASRIQELTRKIDLALLASDAVIAAARAEGGLETTAAFHDCGEHPLRVRGGSVRLWGRAAEAA